MRGDRWVWRVNFRRGKENSYGIIPSPQSAPRGPRAAWKPHPAGFQEGCAKYSSGIGNVVTKPMSRRVGQTCGEAWVDGHLPSTLHSVCLSPQLRGLVLQTYAAWPSREPRPLSFCPRKSGSLRTQTMY